MKTQDIIKLLFILVLSTTGTSCERLEGVDVPGFDCFECYQDKPQWVQLNAVVTINDENPYVPLKIYIGNIEDGIIDWIDTTYGTNYWVDVKPDRYYSIEAKYKDGSRSVYAVDGDKIKLKYDDNSCDFPCYYQKGGYMDVRLK